jgi:hypothetical protein
VVAIFAIQAYVTLQIWDTTTISAIQQQAWASYGTTLTVGVIGGLLLPGAFLLWHGQNPLFVSRGQTLISWPAVVIILCILAVFVVVINAPFIKQVQTSVQAALTPPTPVPSPTSIPTATVPPSPTPLPPTPTIVPVSTLRLTVQQVQGTHDLNVVGSLFDGAGKPAKAGGDFRVTVSQFGVILYYRTFSVTTNDFKADSIGGYGFNIPIPESALAGTLQPGEINVEMHFTAPGIEVNNSAKLTLH